MSRNEGRRAVPRTGRMIAWTVAAALACWGATLAMVRAVAQQATPPGQAQAPVQAPTPDQAPAQGAPSTDDPDSNEESPSARARTPVTREELPEYRDSADNNITLPVDI